jgi:hypothetical protein
MAREDGFFDDLARGLADGTLTRGKALRLMGAALVGGSLGSLGIGEASAAPGGCKRNGKACKKDTQCCSGNCVGGVCSSCPSGTTTCGTECCAGGQECVGGVCQSGQPICTPSCPEGEVCTEGVPGTFPFCQPICNPPCPEGCECERSGDGNGNVCTGFVSGQVPTVDSCDQCPTTDFPQFTVCVDIAPAPDAFFLLCKPPC